MQASIYVPNLQRFIVRRDLSSLGIPLAATPVVSLKIKAPVALEQFDAFEVVARLSSGVEVHLLPRAQEGRANIPVVYAEATAKVNPSLDSLGGTTLIEVDVGREAADGTWHLIVVNLAAAIINAGENPEGTIQEIVLVGNNYHIDDIKLLTLQATRPADQPYLFHIDDIYTQLYDPLGTIRFVYASDSIADKILPTIDATGTINYGNTLVIAHASEKTLAEVNAEFWLSAMKPFIEGVDPDLTVAHYIAAMEAVEETLKTAEVPEHAFAQLRRSDIATGENTNIDVAIGIGSAPLQLPARVLFPVDVPLLTDPVMAEGPYTSDGGFNLLIFTANVGGPHAAGTPAENLLAPVSTSGLDLPRYYPLYKKSSLNANLTAGNTYLTREQLEDVNEALYYAGYDRWPTMVTLRNPPEQILEQMIMTVTVSNGTSEDNSTFALLTGVIPVTNYPPIIEDVDNQVFYVGQGEQTYQLSVTDADSLTLNSANQFEDDMEDIIYEAYINGLPAVMYGPWTESIINQRTGLITMNPQFEGVFGVDVIARDPKGAEVATNFLVFWVNPGSWLNHIPIMTGHFEEPIIAHAGEEITLSLGGIIEDPDIEPVYYVCNLGAVGRINGIPVWTFQTNYPGTYPLEIIAHDSNGGYHVFAQNVIIQPAWAQ